MSSSTYSLIFKHLSPVDAKSPVALRFQFVVVFLKPQPVQVFSFLPWGDFGEGAVCIVVGCVEGNSENSSSTFFPQACVVSSTLIPCIKHVSKLLCNDAVCLRYLHPSHVFSAIAVALDSVLDFDFDLLYFSCGL